MPNKILIVVDMQNDFVDGALGTKEAVAIVDKVAEKIRNWDGTVITTQDTHKSNYLESNEGKHLPVMHCIDGTYGHQLNDKIICAIKERQRPRDTHPVKKFTFGCARLPDFIALLNDDDNQENYEIEFVGLCTDICVVSNALYLKMMFPEATIRVDASCCAGVTPEKHRAALDVMRSCQVEVVNDNTNLCQGIGLA